MSENKVELTCCDDYRIMKEQIKELSSLNTEYTDKIIAYKNTALEIRAEIDELKSTATEMQRYTKELEASIDKLHKNLLDTTVKFNHSRNAADQLKHILFQKELQLANYQGRLDQQKEDYKKQTPLVTVPREFVKIPIQNYVEGAGSDNYVWWNVGNEVSSTSNEAQPVKYRKD